MKQKILRKIYRFLAFFARLYLEKNRPKIIGITGSVGKTSCRTIISIIFKQCLKEKKIYSSPKNYNSELGLMFSIFEIENYNPGIAGLLKVSFTIISRAIFLKPKYDILVLEYGVDHPGDMDFLLTVCKPDISIFTKLDYIHVEYFNSIEDIGNEKFKMIKNTKDLIYLNYKDDFCIKQKESLSTVSKFYNSSDLCVQNYSLKETNNKILASFIANNKKIKTNLLGEENANYIALGFDLLESIYSGEYKILEEYYLIFELQPGRFNVFEGIKNSILIDSTYNAGPSSMKKMIENTIDLKQSIFPEYKIGLVIGDMRELGNETSSSHKSIRKYINKVDFIFTIGKEMKKYLKEKYSFISSKEAGLKLKEYLNNSENKYIILFKGSQNTIFTEEALKQVLLNDNDKNKLVRQSSYWIKKKNDYFNSLK